MESNHGSNSTKVFSLKAQDLRGEVNEEGEESD